jgi:thiamine kinase-like enzyme
MLSGPDFVASSEELGRLLARLQAGGVRLDREWTALHEIDALSHRLPPGEMSWSPPTPDALVPAHRDLHPDQVVVAPDAVHLIDLDEAAMAPPGLDVGNFLAHLDRDAALGQRSGEEAGAAACAFLRGYGDDPPDLAWWRRIALARLACLEEERHGRPDRAVSLRALVGSSSGAYGEQKNRRSRP